MGASPPAGWRGGLTATPIRGERERCARGKPRPGRPGTGPRPEPQETARSGIDWQITRSADRQPRYQRMAFATVLPVTPISRAMASAEWQFETGVSMATTAVRTRGEFGRLPATGVIALAFKADAVGSAQPASRPRAGRLNASAAGATPLRTAFEDSRAFTRESRLSLTSSVEVRLRQDGGDHRDRHRHGHRGGGRVTNAATGLSLDARTRSLVVHQANGFTDRRTSMSLGGTQHPVESIGADGASRPSWGGQALDDAAVLWRSPDGLLRGPAPGVQCRRQVHVSRVGYGLPVGARFVGAPCRVRLRRPTSATAREPDARRRRERPARRSQHRPVGPPSGDGTRSVPTGHGGPRPAVPWNAFTKLVGRTGQDTWSRSCGFPPCPERASGHAWQLAREHSTQDCQAEACEACGLVRMTSYRTGQIERVDKRTARCGLQGRALLP